MQYKGCICGVTEERFTYKLPVSIGCPYNACAFCGLYKHLTYHELPLEQVELELRRVHDLGGAPERVMLGDGNPLWMPFERLQEIIGMIEHYLPSVSSICSDASVLAIEAKSDAELAWLAQHGYERVYVGIESGLDDVLEFMNKDHDNAQAREQVARLHTAGINLGAHIMAGVAGAGRGIENARATAALLNELQPVHICNFSMCVNAVTELGLMEEDGLFVQAGTLELLQEERELVSLLDVPATGLFLEGYHAVYLRKPTTRPDGVDEFVQKMMLVKGDLRDERGDILAALDKSIQDTLEREAAGAAHVTVEVHADHVSAPAA